MSEWQFWEEHWNENMEKDMLEEIRQAVIKENPIAVLVGKNSETTNIFKSTYKYKTRLESGKKVLFSVPNIEGLERDLKIPSKDLIEWIDN